MKTFARTVIISVGVSTFVVAGGDFTKSVEPVINIPEKVSPVFSKFYAGAGVTATSTRDGSANFFDNDIANDKTIELMVLGGYDINEDIAIEGRYYKSVAKEDILDRSSWGIYLKPHVELIDNIELYGLAGFGGYKAKNINGSIVDIDDNGLQFGIGLNYKVNDRLGIFADWVNFVYDKKQNAFTVPDQRVSMDAFTVGLTYRF